MLKQALKNLSTIIHELIGLWEMLQKSNFMISFSQVIFHTMLLKMHWTNITLTS